MQRGVGFDRLSAGSLPSFFLARTTTAKSSETTEPPLGEARKASGMTAGGVHWQSVGATPLAYSQRVCQAHSLAHARVKTASVLI